MGFQTLTGQNPSSATQNAVGADGLLQAVTGKALTAAMLNGVLGDEQSPAMYANLPGVLVGGLCTIAGLIITVPAGTVYYARNVWIAGTSVNAPAVTEVGTSAIWACSDGVLRVTTGASVLPIGFTAQACCLLAVATGNGPGSGSAQISLALQQTGRYADPVGRLVTDGPLVLDYANARVDASQNALMIPNVGSDPAALVNAMVWFRSDQGTLNIRSNGATRQIGASAGFLDPQAQIDDLTLRFHALLRVLYDILGDDLSNDDMLADDLDQALAEA